MEFILKSALISTILYSFYKIFLQKETFFQSIRFYFIIGMIASIILPLLIIPVYITYIPTIITENSTDFISNPEVLEIGHNIKEINEIEFSWITLLSNIYLIGVLIFAIKFILELFSLFYLLFNSNSRKSGKTIYIETTKDQAPFSFFSYIVYNKNQFSKTEMKDIIAHEKVHVAQKHSIDILLIQLLTILQWFNPFIWLFKKDLQQNLEYIADKTAQDKAETHKKYQYLLLKTSIKNNSFALSNNFFNSHLKKRIMMLQKSQTNRLNQIKYLLLIPLIATFLYAFNTKEVFIPEDSNSFKNISKSITKKVSDANPKFILPINKKDLTRLSSGYGMRIHPISHTKTMHNGMDFTAKKGTKVVAVANGEIIFSSFHAKYGNFVKIKHKDGYQTNYAHMNSIAVKIGDIVTVGEKIGAVGNTGESIGNHLHFEIVKDGSFVNPKNYLVTFKPKKVKNETSKYSTAPVIPSFLKAIIYTNFKQVITSKTSDEELQKIEKQFKTKSNIDLKIYGIKRNSNNEIVSIKIDGENKNTSSSFSFSQDFPISDIIINYIKQDNELFIASNNTGQLNKSKTTSTSTKSSSSLHYDSDSNTSRSSSEEYIVNGKKMSKDEYEKMEKSDIKNLSITKTETESHSSHNVDEKKTGWLYFEDHAYFYNTKNNKISFFNKFGDEVPKKLAHKLIKELLRKIKKNRNETTSNESNPTGFVKYKGETYYYSENKPTLQACFIKNRESVESKLSRNDIKNVKKSKLENGKIILRYDNAIKISFYDKFGNDVNPKLSRKLRDQLEKDRK